MCPFPRTAGIEDALPVTGLYENSELRAAQSSSVFPALAL